MIRRVLVTPWFRDRPRWSAKRRRVTRLWQKRERRTARCTTNTWRIYPERWEHSLRLIDSTRDFFSHSCVQFPNIRSLELSLFCSWSDCQCLWPREFKVERICGLLSLMCHSAWILLEGPWNAKLILKHFNELLLKQMILDSLDILIPCHHSN